MMVERQEFKGQPTAERLVMAAIFEQGNGHQIIARAPVDPAGCAPYFWLECESHLHPDWSSGEFDLGDPQQIEEARALARRHLHGTQDRWEVWQAKIRQCRRAAETDPHAYVDPLATGWQPEPAAGRSLMASWLMPGRDGHLSTVWSDDGEFAYVECTCGWQSTPIRLVPNARQSAALLWEQHILPPLGVQPRDHTLLAPLAHPEDPARSAFVRIECSCGWSAGQIFNMLYEPDAKAARAICDKHEADSQAEQDAFDRAASPPRASEEEAARSAWDEWRTTTLAMGPFSWDSFWAGWRYGGEWAEPERHGDPDAAFLAWFRAHYPSSLPGARDHQVWRAAWLASDIDRGARHG